MIPARAQTRSLRTGVWYGDEAVDLQYPGDWAVEACWPNTGRELSQDDMARALENPAGQPPLREMCRGAKRPLVIVDDVNRPTPVSRVLPIVLSHFRQAGISPADVTVLLATGAHAAAQRHSVLEKVGPEAAAACKIAVHDLRARLVKMGKTRFGTPVFANAEVAASDFVLGIGGIYPNQSAGFGGGSKLALGVLGFRSILCLHQFHPPVGRDHEALESSFRKDLDEVARLLRIRTMISVQIDADRKPVRIRCGDYLSYYREETAFAVRTYSAPAPGGADIVIANAYPVDLTLTFALMKGAAPLFRCKPAASRILIAPCPEGTGGHGLFPNVHPPRFHRLKTYAQFAAARPGTFAGRLAAGLRRRGAQMLHGKPGAQADRQNPIWVYTSSKALGMLPTSVPGVRITDSWTDIVGAVQHEQRAVVSPRVMLYPCVPLLSFRNP